MNYKHISLILSLMFSCCISSCELTDLDINEDPNNPEAASLDLLLANSLLRGADEFADNINEDLHGFMALLGVQGEDGFALTNTTYDLDWQLLYSGPLKDVEEIINIAEAQGNNPYYLGIGQLLKAYYYALMVEMWGDLPYSEAFQADAEAIIKYPAYDDDAAIYADLLQLVDDGLENLKQVSSVNVLGDPIYNGDIDSWIKMGKSLKLRMLINTRLVQDNSAEITALIDEGNLIMEGASDFTFQFSSINNPENENRHPWYVEAYVPGTYDFSYISHQLMVEMLDFEDPRRPYYIKRQTSSILNQDDPSDRLTTPCSQLTNCIYGYLVLNQGIIDQLFTEKGKEFGNDERAFLAGFFGRDRADATGLPLDGPLKSALGVYPIAGLYDDRPESASNSAGTGAGIFPMITSEMVKFYIMEAILTGNYSGTEAEVREMLEEVIREHISKVHAFGLEIDPSGVPAVGEPIGPYVNATLEAATDAYVDRWLARYDAAPTTNAKLNVVLKQAWFTNFGNGYEIYNAYRRTGFPNDLQAPLQPQRDFALRLPYAQDDLNFNQSVTEDIRNTAFDGVKIFLDEVDGEGE